MVVYGYSTKHPIRWYSCVRNMTLPLLLLKVAQKSRKIATMVSTLVDALSETIEFKKRKSSIIISVIIGTHPTRNLVPTLLHM